MSDTTPSHRILTTRTEFLDALRAGVDEIATSGCREVWIADIDFADWPARCRPCCSRPAS